MKKGRFGRAHYWLRVSVCLWYSVAVPSPTAVSLASGSSGRRGGFNCGYRTRRAFLPVSEPLLRWLRELALVILGAVHPSRLLLMAPLPPPPLPFIASLR